MPLAPLPLPIEELPASIRRFCDPTAPAAARTMAARGLVPVKGAELVTMLVQLAASSEELIATSAHDSSGKLPAAMSVSAASAAMHPSILDGLATHAAGQREVIEALVL